MAIDLGDVVPLSFQIRDASGALANGGTVVLTITQPDGTAAGPFTLTPTTTGVYDYDFIPTQVGRHVARCVSTGANTAALSDTFDVSDSDPGYLVSLADVKANLRMDLTRTTNDEKLRGMVEAATEQIEHIVGPVVTRTHSEVVEADATIILAKAPVLSLVSITQTVPNFVASPITAANYLLEPATGILRRQVIGGFFDPFGFSTEPFYGLGWYRPQLTVTYTTGRPVIPATIRWGALETVAAMWETQRGAGPMPANGGEQPEQYGREIIPDHVVAALVPFARVGRLL